MAKQCYRVRNWSDYTESLKQRGSLTFWFSEDIQQAWEHKELKKKRGRQKLYSEVAIQCALTLRQLFRLPLRATQGLIGSLVKRLELEITAPDYTTLSRRGKTLKIEFKEWQKGKGMHVLVDSTGIRVIGEGEWKVLKHGKQRWQVWKKLHVALDESNQMILSATVTESVRHDANELPKLLEGIEGEIEQVTGDGAYDKKDCYRAVYKRKAKGVFPPQHDAIVQRNKYKKEQALMGRDEAIEFIKGKEEGASERLKEWKIKNNYHRRSLAETMMYRLKTVFGDEMRSRSKENQQTDLLLRCYAINKINELGMPKSEAIN